MATWLVVLLFSAVAVGLMALGLSLTLIFKGHHIDGEISTNANMRALGITCAVKDAVGGGVDCQDAGCSTDACKTCSTPRA